MTNAYLNLPGHCFVNEINIVNQINVNDSDDQTPAYVTNNGQPPGQPDNLQTNPPKNSIETHGITLPPDMLAAFGFTSEHNITLFITQGRIVITTNPKQLAMMTAIEELQLRQDEILTDFSVAIGALKEEI